MRSSPGVDLPLIRDGLNDLMRRVALHRHFASGVARKANLRQGVADLPPRTVIDAFIGPDEPPYARQYATNLSAATQIRIYSRSAVPIYLFRTETLAGALRPGDYTPMLDLDGIPLSADASGSTLDWRILNESDKTALRLTLSTQVSAVGWNSGALGSGFSISVQIKS